MIVRDKNKEDILYILNNLRKEDELEAKTAIGADYINKIAENILSTDCSFFLAKDNDNVPYAMGGINKTDEIGVVVVWLLSTDKIIEHRHFALKKIKEEVNKIKKNNWLIYNMIFEKNYLAKIWLKKLGFAFIKSRSIPDEFELFYWKREAKYLG